MKLAEGAPGKSRLPEIALAVLLAAATVVFAVLSWGLTYYQDTWDYLMHRQAFDAASFLDPHNEHIVLVPVAIEKALLAVFGMTSAAPEYVVLLILLLATAVALFVYVRRRLGPWPGVMAAALVLFLGPAWTVLLWPFQIGFAGAMLCGISALLALDREDSRGDRWACALLVGCLAFSSLGLAFAAAAAVDVLVQHRRRGWRRAYIVLIPLALFALWYLGWGHNAESHFSLHNVLASPHYLFDGVATSSESLLGLSTLPVEGPGQPEWGRPILIALLVLSGAWVVRHPKLPDRLWPALAGLLTFWLLAAFNYIPSREAAANRYVYAASIFLLLVLANLFSAARPSRKVLAVAAVVVLAAVSSNLVRLNEGSDFLEAQTTLTRADTGALEIARRTVSPEFALTPEIAGTQSLVDVNAAEYFSAVDRYGSPAYTAAELAKASPAGRRQADVVLANALPISVVDVPARPWQPSAPAADAGCTVLQPSTAGPRILAVRGSATHIQAAPGEPVQLALRRFDADEFPVSIEDLAGGAAVRLQIPPDRSSRPWILQIEAQQPVQVCGRVGPPTG